MDSRLRAAYRRDCAAAAIFSHVAAAWLGWAQADPAAASRLALVVGCVISVVPAWVAHAGTTLLIAATLSPPLHPEARMRPGDRPSTKEEIHAGHCL